MITYIQESLKYIIAALTVFKKPALIIMSFTLTPLIQYFQEKLNVDFGFVWYLLFVITIDTFWGVWASIESRKEKPFSFGFLLISFAKKLSSYATIILLIHALVNFTVEGEKTGWYDWLQKLGFAMCITYESYSAVKNAYIVKPYPILGWIISKLEKQIETNEEPEKTPAI